MNLRQFAQIFSLGAIVVLVYLLLLRNGQWYALSKIFRSCDNGISKILYFDDQTQERALEVMVNDLKIKHSSITSQRLTCTDNLVVFLEKENELKKDVDSGALTRIIDSWRNSGKIVDTGGGYYDEEDHAFSKSVQALYLPQKPHPEDVNYFKSIIEANSANDLTEISCEDANKLLWLKLSVGYTTNDKSTQLEDHPKLLEEYINLKKRIDNYKGVKIVNEKTSTWWTGCF